MTAIKIVDNVVKNKLRGFTVCLNNTKGDSPSLKGEWLLPRLQFHIKLSNQPKSKMIKLTS